MRIDLPLPRYPACPNLIIFIMSCVIVDLLSVAELSANTNPKEKFSPRKMPRRKEATPVTTPAANNARLFVSQIVVHVAKAVVYARTRQRKVELGFRLISQQSTRRFHVYTPHLRFLTMADSLAASSRCKCSGHFTWHSYASACPPSQRQGGPRACAG